MQEWVTVNALASELGMDKSNARKYIMRHGVEFLRVRVPGVVGKPSLALSLADAELIREARRREGYTFTQPVAGNGLGYFYVVQLVPELMPTRLKFGYASDVDARLKAHRTAAPTAVLVASWPCKASWEQAAIACAVQADAQMVGPEVYDCENLQDVTERLHSLFSLLPNPHHKA